MLSTDETTAPPGTSTTATAIVEGAHDAIIGCEPDGTIAVLNPAAEALLASPRDKAIGESLATVLGAGNVPEWMEALERTARGETVAQIQLQHPRPDGSMVDIGVLPSPVPSDDGDTGVSFIVRDISARRAGERELALTRAELEHHTLELGRSNSDLEQFAYVASHDLSEPLRAITGMLALLHEELSDDLPEAARDYMERATAGAARMRALIDDLLIYSRLGREQQDRAPVDLGALCVEVATGLDASPDAVVRTTPLPVVDGSPSQLRQLLQNLISNGLKFNHSERPLVELTAHHADGDWTITVTDNGIGIPDEYAGRIFGVFKRLHTRDAYPGTGIGLAICERIVQRHGGRIWAEPGRSHGARISFTLPAIQADGGPHA